MFLYFSVTSVVKKLQNSFNCTGKKKDLSRAIRFSRKYLFLHRNFTWKILDPCCCVAHTHTHSLGSVARRRPAKDTAAAAAGEKIGPKNQDGEQPSTSSLEVVKREIESKAACWDRDRSRTKDLREGDPPKKATWIVISKERNSFIQSVFTCFSGVKFHCEESRKGFFLYCY